VILRYATREQMAGLLAELGTERELYGPRKVGDDWRLMPVSSDEFEVGPARTVEPLKAVFFQARENLGECFAKDVQPEVGPRALAGIKACDLSSLEVLDYVFLEGDYQDPYYKARRDATFLVSADCAEPKDVCFCTFCNGQPYPETGFDLNLSELEDGYIIQAGSDAGREFLDRHGGGLADPSADQVKELEGRRERAEKQVAEQVQEVGLARPENVQKDILRSAAAPVWEKCAEACVECGACNFICPTCHCFLLSDLEEAGRFHRFKNWDSCQYVAFAKVAGGANPRPHRADRFRNRFEKKFDFFAEMLGRYACTGCGRCIEACAGKIDIRETLRDVANV